MKYMNIKQNTLILSLAGSVVLGAMVSVWLQRPQPLPDFEHADAAVKKQAFFDYLSPVIDDVSDAIKADREHLLALLQNEGSEDTGHWQTRQLHTLAAKYEIDLEDVDSHQALIDKLLLRIDVVPKSLALVQAAKESGWGSSRFARNGYNLFGQQCFERGCGFTPAARTAGKRHEVADFDSVEAAVRAYMHNLNTHFRYRDFRLLRAKLRSQGERLSGIQLAQGLSAYSERGDAYVNEIKALIRHNELE